MSSPLRHAPAAIAEQFATWTSPSEQAIRAQMQVALSCEKQQVCPDAGGGHSPAALPSVTPASDETEAHWQNDEAGSARQV